MLHFIFVLLKIVGFILLGILGLLLALAFLVLWVPIRYKSKGSYYDKPKAECTIYWLFHIIHGRLIYEEGKPRIKIRLFGYPLIGGKKRKPKKKGSRKVKKLPQEQTKQRNQRQSKKPMSLTQARAESQKKAALPTDTLQNSTKETQKNQSEAERKGKEIPPSLIEDEVTRGKKSTTFQKISSFLADSIIKIKEGFRNLKFTIKRICVRLKEISKDYHSLTDYLKSDEWKRLFRFIKKEIIGIIKHIRPRKYFVKGKFGFSNPADTGILLGGLALLPFIYKKRITLIPDFNESVLEGEYFVKGRIYCGYILIAALKIYFNKDIKNLHRKWQAHGERS